MAPLRWLLPFLLLGATAPAPALAQSPPPLLGFAEALSLPPPARSQAERFLRMNTPRVFVAGPDGRFGWQAGGGTPEEVERRALESCQRNTAITCRVVVRDLSIVAPGHVWSPGEPPPGMRIASMSRETVPDPNFLWWGPERARGVLVFGHGRGPGGADSRGRQPQGWTRHFNNAGYDIWRFDRHPSSDEAVRAAGWLRDDLAELRRRGYRHVVVAGQSRGGWNALMVMDSPGLADVHIAIAPAAHGDSGGPVHARQLDDLRAIIAAAAGAPRARLAVANFRNDDFDAEPERRGAMFRELGARSAAFLFIDRPEQPTGHGAGGATAFNDRFGPCLFRFATMANPPSGC